MELVQFFFGNGWHFWGLILLISVVGFWGVLIAEALKRK